MKPSIKQQENIKAIVSTIEHWMITNDINSPSHWNLNDEWYTSILLQYDIDNELQNEIGEKLSELWILIKRIK